MLKDYYKQSMRALQLAGMNKNIHGVCTRAVLELVNFYEKTPDKIK